MARVTGLGSFVVITLLVLAGLRSVHLAVPIAFPETRPGPIAIDTLDDVRRVVGFAPVIPAYHPAALGALPTRITGILSPSAMVTIVWQTPEAYLSVTTRRDRSRPTASPLAVPLADRPDASWWFEGSRAHALVARDGLWIEVETSLGEQELRRFVDTLSHY